MRDGRSYVLFDIAPKIKEMNIKRKIDRCMLREPISSNGCMLLWSKKKSNKSVILKRDQR